MLTDQQRAWLTSFLGRDGTGDEIVWTGGQRQSDDTRHDGVEPALMAAEGGASGREEAVDQQVSRTRSAAEAQGATAFDGDVYRSVGKDHASTFADHSYSAPGRYNAPGESALYTASSMDDLKAEARNYANADHPTGLEDKAIVQAHLKADLLDATAMKEVRRSALTEGYGAGGQQKSLLTKVTGEDPYTLPRTVADVARDKGMSGVIAPANETGTNIVLMPSGDAPPDAPTPPGGPIHDGLTYQSHQVVDPSGTIGPTIVDPASIKANIPDATPNRATTNPLKLAETEAADAASHGRAGGARYGAAGAAAVTLGEDALHGHFDSQDAADLVVNTGEGAAMGATDTALSGAIETGVAKVGAAVGVTVAEGEGTALSAAAGAASAGVIGGVVGAGTAVFQDADAVHDGTMKAGDATADVVVEGGIGVGAGLAGAAAGAAIGSVIPIAGTAVGAVVGFGVGMVASAAATYAAHASGLADEAKHAIGGFLDDHLEKPLEKAWSAVTPAVDAVEKGVGAVKHTVAAGAHKLAEGAESAAKAVEHAAADALEAGKKTVDAAEKAASKAVGKVEAAVSDEVKAAEKKVGEAAKAVEAKVGHAAAAVEQAAGSAVNAVEGAAKGALDKLASLF